MGDEKDQYPVKRPRVITLEELQKDNAKKTSELELLNKKFNYIVEENSKLRKIIERFYAHPKEGEISEYSSSGDEMDVGEEENTNAAADEDDHTRVKADTVAQGQGNTSTDKSNRVDTIAGSSTKRQISQASARAGSSDGQKLSQTNAIAGSTGGKQQRHASATASSSTTQEAVKKMSVHKLNEVPATSQRTTAANKETEKGESKSKSVPVITTFNINIKEVCVKLEDILGHKEYNIKILGRNVTNIGVCTLEDFSKLKILLGELGVHYYTHTPKAQRPFSIIVKGLSGTFEKEEVLSYMQGIKVNMRIIGLHKIGGDRWLFQLGRESDLKGFRNIRYILHCRVSTEKHARRDVIQCYNCQRFGHVAINCNMPYRCVKCGGSHGPGNCEVPPRGENNVETLSTDPVTGQAVRKVGLPVRCANCDSEGHAASARECPKRIQLLRKLATKREAGRVNDKRASVAISRTVSGFSYAAAARAAVAGGSPTVRTESNSPSGLTASSSNGRITLASARAEFDIIDGDCRRLLGGSLMDCLGKMRDFAREYRTLGSDGERSRALLGMLISLQHDG